jgi:hypothetical protein
LRKTRSEGLFKVFFKTRETSDDHEYETFQFFDFEKMFSIVPKDDKSTCYHLIANNETKLVKPNFLEDYNFHYIDKDGTEIGTAPVLTFNVLIFVVPSLENPGFEPAIVSSFNKQLTSQDIKQKTMILKYFIDSLELFKKYPLFYAPFVTICQSSGVGKSKFVIECGEDIPLIYGVFRSVTDKSYPPASKWIKLFVKYVLEAQHDTVSKGLDCNNLIAESYSIGRVLIFLNIILDAYKQLFLEMHNHKKGEDYSNVFKKINLMFHKVEGHIEFAKICEEKLKSCPKNITFHSVFENIRNILAEIRPKIRPEYSNAPFVIVFDELSLLLDVEFNGRTNLFHIIRRALNLLPSENMLDLLIVGIGTNGNVVSNFNKEVRDDSLRFFNRKIFLPSMVLGSNWDIFKKIINLKEFKLSDQNVRNSKMIKLLCSFGRALWSSLPLSNVMTIAQGKLVNGSDTTLYTSLAIWSIRTSLSLNSDLALSRTLLRSYMAIAFSISYNAETMNVAYPSEPILALAARDLSKPIQKYNFSVLLDDLLEFVQFRPIDKGEITEIMFSQIVLMAIDRAQNVASKKVYEILCVDSNLNQIFNAERFLLEFRSDKESTDNSMDIDSHPTTETAAPASTTQRSPLQDYYHITTVELFLKSLYGNIIGDEICLHLDVLKDGIINASHVISSLNKFPFGSVYEKSELVEHFKDVSGENEGIIDRALLRNLFLRQAALKTPPRYLGIDLCIPVLLEDPSCAKTDEGLFTYIGLQFKATFECENIVIPKMDPCLHFTPCAAHKNNNCPSNCHVRIKESDFDFIYKSHLLLYMSANYLPDSTLIRREPQNSTIVLLRDSVKVQKFDKVIPYYVTKSFHELAQYNDLLSDDNCEMMQKIIHAQNDPFKSADSFQIRKVADNVLTMSPLRYLDADTDLRSERELEPVPELFSFTDLAISKRWSDFDVTKKFISDSSKKANPKILEL